MQWALLQARARGTEKSPPAVIVIVGAGGELTKRQLVPSLDNLADIALLDDAGEIVGFDIAQTDDAGWKATLSDIIQSFVHDKDAEFHPSTVNAGAERPGAGDEVLIDDCLTGDATLFQRADAIEASWAIVDPVLGPLPQPPAERATRPIDPAHCHDAQQGCRHRARSEAAA